MTARGPSVETTLKLVRMANQIGLFFESQPGDAAAAVADHLRKYWPPSMRETILAYVESGGAGLDPVPRRAIAALRTEGRQHDQGGGCATAHALYRRASERLSA